MQCNGGGPLRRSRGFRRAFKGLTIGSSSFLPNTQGHTPNLIIHSFIHSFNKYQDSGSEMQFVHMTISLKPGCLVTSTSLTQQHIAGLHKLRPTTCVLNKVLLEHNHAHWWVCSQGCLRILTAQLSCDGNDMAPKAQRVCSPTLPRTRLPALLPGVHEAPAGGLSAQWFRSGHGAGRAGFESYFRLWQAVQSLASCSWSPRSGSLRGGCGEDEREYSAWHTVVPQ